MNNNVWVDEWIILFKWNTPFSNYCFIQRRSFNKSIVFVCHLNNKALILKLRQDYFFQLCQVKSSIQPACQIKKDGFWNKNKKNNVHFDAVIIWHIAATWRVLSLVKIIMKTRLDATWCSLSDWQCWEYCVTLVWMLMVATGSVLFLWTSERDTPCYYFWTSLTDQNTQRLNISSHITSLSSKHNNTWIIL